MSDWDKPDILPCEICGLTPTYVGSHGNTFGDPPYHVHHNCKPLCECHTNSAYSMRSVEISRWNKIVTRIL